MGSLKFVYKDPQIMGSILVRGYFEDTDGALVDVDINLDKLERIYELDIWKTTFDPLIKYPQAEDVWIPFDTTDYTLRNLTADEKILITTLSAGTTKEAEISKNLSLYVVQEMRDGGTKSLWFTGKDRLNQFIGSVLAEGIFLDEDNSIVSARINLDKDGDLYQLDIWKYSYTRLLKYPDPEDITILRN